MKRISIFLLLATLVWSCSKDNSNEITENQIQHRQSVDYQIDNFDPPRNYGDLRDCYNQFVKDGVETFNEKFGEDLVKKITYVTDGNVSQVIPLFKGDVMENILWINEEYYYLINRMEEHDSFGNPLRSYSNIFNLTKTEFISGNITVLLNDYTVQNSENELRLTEKQSTTTPDQIYAKAAPDSGPCTQWENEWLEIYYSFLNIPLPIGGDLPPDVIPFSVMEEIVVTATGGECVCPSPCLVIEALNNNSNVWNSMKDLVNQNWVMFEYGLDQFTVENIESDLLKELIFFNCNPTSIVDPCSGDPISTSTLINSILNSGFPHTLEGFYDELNKEDHIINRLTDPRLRCIYKFLALGSDAVFCNTFENFVGETDINLNLQNSNQVVGYGLTTPYFLTPNSPYGNIIDIALNENQLEGLCEVTVACTFLHEGIHAEMFRLLNDDSIDPEDFPTIWDEYDINISQHANMANAYINILSDALKQRFGDRYSDDEYEAIAWFGLGNVAGEDVNTSAWNNLTPTKQSELQQLFENVNSDCSEDNCK